MRMNRFGAWLGLFASLSLAACGDSGSTGGMDAGSGSDSPCAIDPLSAECKCNIPRDCTPQKPEDKLKWLCTASHRCMRTCLKDADCVSGDVCEDAVCRPPSCGANSECASGEFCSGGNCKPAVTEQEVASCVVLPERALLHEGKSERFQLLARDANGKTLAYTGPVGWIVDGGASVDPATVVVTGGSQTGTVNVTAIVNGTDCTGSVAVNYASAPITDVRVVVADLMTRKPVSGAIVVVGTASTQTNASGIALFPGDASNKKTVSVFDVDYAYVTVVDAKSNDLVIYARPKSKVGVFAGDMTPRSFDDLADLKGAVHLALLGNSVPGNWIDLQLASLLGPLVNTTINLGAPQVLPLPSGTVLGLGEEMYKGHYDVYAPTGIRTLWGLGGNADFSAIATAIGGLFGSGPVDIGPTLTKFLPVLGRLQSGVRTGLEASWNEAKSEPVVIDVSDQMKLDTLLRMKAEVTLPDLPTYKRDGQDVRIEGAIVLGGSMYQPQGFVPLGITASVDGDPAAAVESLKPDGKIDPTDPGGAPGTVSLRLASAHGGLETSHTAIVALATSLSNLVAGDGTSVALSGLVRFPGRDTGVTELVAKDVNQLSMGRAFLGFPETPSLDGRTFQRGGAVSGAKLHRLDIGTEATGEWYVYFPAEGGSFDIPTPPSNFRDRFAGVTATSCTSDADCLPSTCEAGTKVCKAFEPAVLVQSVSFGDATIDFDDVMDFDGVDMDDLTQEIRAFSVRDVVRSTPQ